MLIFFYCFTIAYHLNTTPNLPFFPYWWLIYKSAQLIRFHFGLII